MIHRQHGLFCFQAKLPGNLLDRINRSPVHVRLARLAQPPITDWNTETIEQALERRRPAVHGGGLDDLRSQQAAGRGHTRSREAPSTKHQAPEKLQALSSKAAARFCLELEVWCFSGAWSLELGAFVASGPLVLASTFPAARSTSVAGESRSTCTSTVPAKPC